jgi:transcriptional regulator with GAF, ATPase, and Fis domain
MVGSSPALRNALAQLDLVAPTDSTVLLLGESGTGKELFARAIHERSSRREGPLVKVSSGSIPADLFESEFFGHVKGAFTGATKDRDGRFQTANGGTLFLDEVAEIPLSLQPKLLRVLQEGELERVGEDTTRRVDVRVVAATNRSLRAEVAAGRFRRDLYYRLNVFPLEIPPLRDRAGDIPQLAAYFAESARRRVGRPAFRIGPRDLEALAAHSWPGNVRELANVIERAAILSAEGATVDFRELLDRSDGARNTASGPPEFVTEEAWREREKENLVAALEAAHWRLYGPGGAAQLLGMKPTTLASRLKALGIQRPRE